MAAVAASDLPEGDPMICRSIRKAASALLLASVLALSAAHALGRPGRPRAGEDSWQMPEHGFFALLLHLFAPARGTMDPNGYPTGGG